MYIKISQLTQANSLSPSDLLVVVNNLSSTPITQAVSAGVVFERTKDINTWVTNNSADSFFVHSVHTPILSSLLLQTSLITTPGGSSEDWNNASNRYLPISGGKILNNLVIGGTLTVLGSSVNVATSSLNVNDPLIYIAQGNTTNLFDIGVVGHFYDGLYQHTGLVRNHTTKQWSLFSGVTSEPENNINWTDPTFKLDYLNANFVGSLTGNVSGTAQYVANGVYTTGTYYNPPWISTLDSVKITGDARNNWDSGYYITTGLNLSANNWNTAYVTSSSLNLSANNWNTAYASTVALNPSANNWNTAYASTVALNPSANNWNTAYASTVALNLSANNWNVAYASTVALNLSANNWNTAYVTSSSLNLSANNWNTAYVTSSSLNLSANNWNSVYSLINTTTASTFNVYNLSAANNVNVFGTLSSTNVITSNLSSSNIIGFGNQMVLSDGLSFNNTGNGANTLSLNFSNGVYMSNLNAKNLSLTNATVSNLTNPVTASNSFLILNINGVNKALQLWDFTS
jgi:hypothetical protein